MTVMEIALERRLAPRKPRLGAAAVGVVLAVLGLAFISQIGAMATPSASSTAASSGALASYGKLPLSFVPNAGQSPSRIRFSAQGGGYTFGFAADRALLSFTKAAGTQTLALAYLGSNPDVQVRGQERLRGTVSYFVGADRSRWHAGIATYREVVYPSLWPGIDMVWRGAKGSLEYEFLVRPGARVQDIRLAYQGATGVSLSAAGDLLAATRLGVLTDSRPRSYQEIGGKVVPVSSNYVLAPDGRMAYGFGVGRYDSRYALVIDPGLRYSTFLGGAGPDAPFSVAADEHGNAYVSGFTGSVNFPTTPGAFQPASGGSLDGFVTKLNRSGSALVYSTYLGGMADDIALDVAIDEDNRAYVVGLTQSGDFPTTPGSFQATDPDPGAPDICTEDGFVTKLNSSGTALVYSTYLGSTGEDSINGVAVDKEGNAVVAGSGDTSNFPTTPGSFQPTDPTPGPCVAEDPRPPNNTATVAKLNRTGSGLIFATYLGGRSGFVNVNSMTIDKHANVYVTGPADDDYPTTPGAFMSTDPAPGTDAFVTKLRASGSALVYSTYLGGGADDSDEGGLGIGVDKKGYAYATGRTGSPFFPTTDGAYDTSLSGPNDGYVTKLNRSGSALEYSTYLGGSGIEEPHFSVGIDEDGRAHIVGVTDSVDFPTTPDAVQSTWGGSLDGFMTVFNPAGSALDYSTFLGGIGRDIANGVALDDDESVYVTGSTRSANFPTTTGAFDTTQNGSNDTFVTKLAIADDD